MVSIDAHTHSTFSDGTQTPSEMVEEAVAAGLDVIALADHDTTLGWTEAEAAAARSGLGLVRGMELSTRRPTSGSLHLLAYLFDPHAPRLAAEAKASKDSRVNRAQRMVELIGEDYPITWEDVLSQFGPDTTIGRPHIADALVAAGSVRGRSEAFATILRSNGPYDVHHYAPGIFDAIEAVTQAGGVPVLAHPLAATRGERITETLLDEMREAGLAGLEVDHRDNTDADRAYLREYAQRHGMIVTGSSDYHGAGKPNRLGENLTAEDQLARIVQMASGVPLLPAKK